MLFSIFVLSGSLTAQENMPRRQKRVTYEQMTEKMVKELQLDEKQKKKVAKLNKKYKTLIEGEQVERPQGQRPPMGERPSGRPSGGMGGPGGGMPGGFGGGMPGGGFGGRGGGMPGSPRGGMPGEQSQEKSYDYDKQQQKYDKAIGKILSEQQYESYLKIKPQFASQRRVWEFLLGGQLDMGQGRPGGMGRPGGPGSRQINITYAGATELTANATEISKTKPRMRHLINVKEPHFFHFEA